MKHSIFVLLICLLPASVSAAGYDARLRHKFWTELYPDGGWTLYCNERFESGDRRGLNIEHVYPASWMAKHIGCGSRKRCRKVSRLFSVMESDLRNLWPSLSQYNQIRGDYPFGEIPGEKWKYSGCDFEQRGKLVEPSQRARGQIARVMFYMRDTYGLPINDKLMKRWASRYPVTDEERRRNRLGIQQ